MKKDLSINSIFSLKRLFVAFLLGLLVFFSCKSNKQEYRLVAIENVQFLFERFVIDSKIPDNSSPLIKGKLFSELRGNVLFIQNVAECKKFIQQNGNYILSDPQLSFCWDTLGSVKKLYVLDQKKGVSFTPLKVDEKTNNQTNKIVFNLNENDNTKLSNYQVKNLGKEMIVLKNGEFLSHFESVILSNVQPPSK